MKTKLFIMLCLLLAAASTVTAQIKERGFFAEMNIGYGKAKLKSTLSGDRYVILAPALGYQINRDWAAGIKGHFETGDNKEYSNLGVYGQYAFLHKKNLKVFSEATLSYNIDKRSNIDGGSPEDYTEAGFSFGASYALSKHLSVMARYLHIGYSGSHPYSRSAVLGGGEWVVDANLRRLSVGLQLIF